MKAIATVTSSPRRTTQPPEAVKYVIYFSFIFFVLYTVYQYLEAHRMFAGYHSWLASSVASAFNVFDPGVEAVDNLILYHGAPSLDIISDCDGLAFVCLILAAVLPFARPMMSRLVGFAVLISFLLLFNWLRIFILGIVRFYYPDLFQLVHLYAFQPIMILVTLISFMAWIIASESPGAVR